MCGRHRDNSASYEVASNYWSDTESQPDEKEGGEHRGRILVDRSIPSSRSFPRSPDGSRSPVVIGQVVGIHVDDAVIDDGMIDVRKLDPLARLGYLQYAKLDFDNLFEMRPPKDIR